MIDLYCERVGSGLLAEPLNAGTNALFLLAAAYGWRRAGRRRDARALALLIAAIGIGSALFHTFATAWAQWLDVGPILVFQITYLVLYVRRAARAPLTPTMIVVLLLMVSLAGAAAAPGALNGSLSYAPAAITLFAIGVHHALTAPARRFSLLLAAGVFVASLTARTVDLAFCAAWPAGTHFLWHALNALVLYITLAAYVWRVEAVAPGVSDLVSRDSRAGRAAVRAHHRA